MRRTLLVPSLSPEGRGGGRYRRRGLQLRAMLTPSSTRASRSTRTTRGASGGGFTTIIPVVPTPQWKPDSAPPRGRQGGTRLGHTQQEGLPLGGG